MCRFFKLNAKISQFQQVKLFNTALSFFAFDIKVSFAEVEGFFL